MKSIHEIQCEITDWANHNFPHASYIEPYYGMIEELGEFAHSHLKSIQRIRQNEDHNAGKEDALGDFAIYLLHFCALTKRDGEDCFNEYKVTYSGSDLGCDIGAVFIKYLNMLAASDLAYTAIGGLINTLHITARQLCGKPFPVILNETWEKVKQRDWQKNKNTGNVEFKPL